MNDVHEWFNGAKNVLFVHAHPDDEVISTGATIAALQEAGLNPVIVTLTRGEEGELRDGVQLKGKDLAEHRVKELECAMRALGDPQHVFLGTAPARNPGMKNKIYADSGMRWAAEGVAAPAENTGDLALTKQPVYELLDDIAALAVAVDAGAVVSYDANGGYGHPDHVLAHKLARALGAALEIDFWEIRLGDEPQQSSDSMPLVTHDATAWLGQKKAALECYASQLEVLSDFEIRHVGGQEMGYTALESFALCPWH